MHGTLGANMRKTVQLENFYSQQMSETKKESIWENFKTAVYRFY